MVGGNTFQSVWLEVRYLDIYLFYVYGSELQTQKCFASVVNVNNNFWFTRGCTVTRYTVWKFQWLRLHSRCWHSANNLQEAQLSPSDRAMHLAKCHTTVQKLLIRQVLTKLMVWSWRFSWRQCVMNNVHSTIVANASKRVYTQSDVVLFHINASWFSPPSCG